MKTLKQTLLLALLLVAFSFTKAQCNFGVWANPNGATVQFYSFIDSTNLPTSYYIDFGDGDTAHSLYPSHTYAASGTYTYCVHVTGICTGDTCGTVTVDVCDFNPQITQSVNNLTATFGVANVPPGSTYSWGLHNTGTLQTSTSATPSITYSAYGDYWVTLAVTTPDGCVDSAYANAHIANPCAAGFGQFAQAPYTIQFYASPWDSLTPPTYTYNWSFGDGATSTLQGPLHNYGVYDTFSVCLTVSAANCYDSICRDVVVSEMPPRTYNLAGSIAKGSSAVCSGFVYLISDSAGFLSLVESQHIGDSCSGRYFFQRVTAGTYYLKAALDSLDPDYNNYLPTYFTNELNWADATAISVVNDDYNNNFALVAGVNPGGPGFIGGYVSQGAGLAIGGHDESRSTGDPLPNIQVNLLTAAGVPVASTYTDGNGRYTFSNLKLDTYKVYAEEINKVPAPLNVTINANNPLQDDVNVSINSNSAVTGLDDLSQIKIEGISPNPVTDKTVIAINLQKSAQVHLVLTDITGRVLQNRNLDLTTGANQIKLDLSNHSAGVYHVTLSNASHKTILKLIKAN